MPSIAPRARCGLPANPRQWLNEKKPILPSRNVPNQSQQPIRREENSSREPQKPIQTKSPIVEEDYEDLLDCYSTDQETRTSSRPITPLEVAPSYRFPSSAGPHDAHKYQASDKSTRNSSSDLESRVSSASDPTGMKILTTNSYGKSFTRKRRNYPVHTSLELFQIAPSTTKVTHNKRAASIDSWVNDLNVVDPEVGKKGGFQQNTIKQHTEDKLRSQTLGHTRNHSRTGNSDWFSTEHEVKLNTAVPQEPDYPLSPQEETFWDEYDLLEAYSSQESDGSSRDSFSTHTNPNELQTPQDVTQLTSFHYETELRPPASAKSDSSHYSMESAAGTF
ncbi:hypothetical protein Pst134EA_011997 [Puccinia striiformis f. sp. tritici]|uniref:Uncharacterized protein n=1 Tax=Puccinia striiformis f. sp. tritici PST-78 TaxID=1165861 RepID=A0A0L0V3U7_9BASI|nr:hypothetical protein Pst134EA_011997 [Puccinia striiformis f. sp. tritici]KAI9619437.1 hypothetical protein H4Q26_014199 [Puccinia striiformis f. sp. tritici PST-130]KNE93876.1 hypothetical protein PSTG_12788 [Puccinia striiformis f. sp. tritici PST-78]KAH9456748.1 hypothetical protein Pst134EB_012952 [Puccinia striiformis f. sp. tritici]KAH9468374.1 hypothetical protein Pst134EA_011997 [Puccinia striiformis f. sp. tritici]KAI9631217.1 hypothetical protein KEM48_013146 [Puccinia striiformis